MRKHYIILISLIILLSIIPIQSILNVQAYVKPRIIDPLYSVPVPVVPGDIFNITLETPPQSIVKSAVLEAPGKICNLTIIESEVMGGTQIIKVYVPTTCSYDLYDLIVNVEIEETQYRVISYNSVWIYNQGLNSLKILHLTDTHLDIDADGYPSSWRFETGIRIAEVLNVTLIFVTGDLVDLGNDVEALKKFRDVSIKSRKPIFAIPGNHDWAGAGPNFPRLYGLYVGHRYWFRVLGKFLIIGLDTGSEGYVDTEQIRFFEEVCAKYRNRTKIVLIHHPFFGYDAWGYINGSWKEFNKIQPLLYGSWAAQLGIAKEFLRIVEEYNVSLVIAGHIHTDRVVIYNGKTYFITTGASGGPVREGDFREFRVLTINSRGKVMNITAHGKDLFKPMNAFNIEKILLKTFEKPNATILLIRVEKGSEVKIMDSLLSITIHSRESPKLFKYNVSADVVSINEFRSRNCIVAKLRISIEEGVEGIIALSTYVDKEPPVIKSVSQRPRTPYMNRDTVHLNIYAEDNEWGIYRIYAFYTYKNINETIVAKFLGNYYQVSIPPLNTRELHITIIAKDFAGNTNYYKLIIKYKAPLTTSPTTPTTPTSPTTPTAPTTPIITTTPTTSIATTTIPTTSTSPTQITSPTTPTTPITPTTTTTQVERIISPFNPLTIGLIIGIVVGITIIVIIMKIRR